MDSADEDARAAIAELRRMLATQVAAEAVQLTELADRAALCVREAGNRAKISEALLGALTVIKFASTFGTDPAPAVEQAGKLLDGLEQLSRME